MDEETAYLLKRAEDEAHKALSSSSEDAAAVHQALSVRYSAKASSLLAEKDEPASGES